MPQETAGSSKFGQSNISTLVAMEEPEESTTLYAWKDGKLKKLPYDEHTAQSGQKIKTFYTFSKEEKVIIVTVDKHHMSLSISTGIIREGEVEASEPEVFLCKNNEDDAKENIHRIPINNPVLFFSLNRENFGEEIKGVAVRDSVTNELMIEFKFRHGQYACAGISADKKK